VEGSVEVPALVVVVVVVVVEWIELVVEEEACFAMVVGWIVVCLGLVEVVSSNKDLEQRGCSTRPQRRDR
jgi:hypothetical protein